MSFIVSGSGDSVPVKLMNDDGSVSLMVGDMFILAIEEDGTLNLCDYVCEETVGPLKLTDEGEYGSRRARVFFCGEELVLPSEIKAAKKSAPKKGKGVR